MIKAQLLSATGEHTTGSVELVPLWQGAPDSFLWLDIQGEITSDIRVLLQGFGCNDLAINDCSRTRHPPKVESFETNCFLLFRGFTQLDDALNLVPQQLGFWVGKNYLITVHKETSVSIDQAFTDAAREGLLRSPNILTLRLLHFAAGRYLEKLMTAEERIATLEDELLDGNAEEVLKELVTYRSRLRKLRRIFNYHQRIAETILQDGSVFLGTGKDESYHIRRDLYDRCERLSSLCSLYYELCGDLVDGHISLSSHRLNNTMKVLTIITAVFVPITFIAGIYGMNFDNMPELHHEYGYYIVIGAITTIAAGMIMLFKKIRWL